MKKIILLLGMTIFSLSSLAFPFKRSIRDPGSESKCALELTRFVVDQVPGGYSSLRVASVKKDSSNLSKKYNFNLVNNSQETIYRGTITVSRSIVYNYCWISKCEGNEFKIINNKSNKTSFEVRGDNDCSPAARIKNSQRRNYKNYDPLNSGSSSGSSFDFLTDPLSPANPNSIHYN